MFADPKKVPGRRLRRRLKAGAAVALAMVAGAFLACKGGGDAEPPSPMGPDARGGPGAREVDAGAADGAAAATSASAVASDSGTDAAGDAANTIDGDAGSDAGSDASSALVVRDAGADGGPKAPKVDRHEHRKGMPVRDNLLE